MSTWSIRSKLDASRTEQASAVPPARGHGHGHGRGQTQGTRAGDDEHGRRVQHAGLPAPPPKIPQPSRVTQRDREHRRHEVRGDAVSQPLHPGLRPLRLADHPHDPLERGSRGRAAGPRRATCRRRSRSPPSPGRRAACQRGHFAREHALVDARLPLDHGAIDGHGLARPHPHPVALATRRPGARRPPPRRAPPGRSSAPGRAAARWPTRPTPSSSPPETCPA